MVTLARRLLSNERGRGTLVPPATTGEGFGAMLSDPTLSERGGIRDTIRESDLAAGLPAGSRRIYGMDVPFRAPESGELDDLRSPVLSPEELTNRYGHLGLTFDGPMSERGARALADTKRAEMVRDDVLSRTSGIAAMGAQFGAAMLASAIDPLELAATFIPVIGPARHAAILARLGRVGGRATVGVTEGAIGNALIEPFMVGFSRQLQLDYTMTDSLRNVAAGAALGGFGGAALGAVSRLRGRTALSGPERAVEPPEGMVATPRPVAPDAVLRASPAQRMAAFKAAVAQAAQGRTIEVPRMRGREGQVRPVSLLQFLADRGVRDDAAELSHIGAHDWHRQPRVRGELGFRRRVVREDGMPLDDAAEAAMEAGYIANHDVNELLDAVSRELGGERVVSKNDALDERAFVNALEASDPDPEARALLARLEAIEAEFPRIGPEDAERVAAIMARENIGPDEAMERLAIQEEARATAVREGSPERDYSGDAEASRRFDEIEDFDPFEADDEDLMAFLDQMRQDGRLSRADEDALAEADGMAKHAAAFAKTARAAAVCLAR